MVQLNHIDQQNYAPHKDGGYKMLHAVKEANDRLEQYGKTGKQAKLVIKGKYLKIQFNNPEKSKQDNPSMGLVSLEGITEAEVKAKQITLALISGTFTQKWCDELLGKVTQQTKQQQTQDEPKQVVTFHQVYEVLMNQFEKRKKRLKNPLSAYANQFKKFEAWQNDDKPFTTANLIKWINSLDDTQAKVCHLRELVKVIPELELSTEYVTLVNNLKDKIEVQKRENNHLPDDNEIVDVYRSLRDNYSSPNKLVYLKRLKQLRFYGIMAIYGIRIHEGWHIINWDNEVVIRNGEFLAVDNESDSDNESNQESILNKNDITIPAINDPNNTDKILVISKGKTGKRVAMPCMPDGQDWFKEFDLLGHNLSECLPDVSEPFKKDKHGNVSCTQVVGKWFWTNVKSFTAHKLRHACNNRLHDKGLTHKAIADSLGHRMTTNQGTYLKFRNESMKAQGIISAYQNNQNEVKEIDRLKTENEALKERVKQLETELRLMKELANK